MPPTRPSLTRERVIETALGLIDEKGLEACTMRAVANVLGVEAMSLYWHVDGKDGLLDGVVELVLAEFEALVPSEDEWRARLEAIASVFRQVIMRHRNVVPLLSSRRTSAYAAAGQMTDRTITLLESAGFDRRTAINAARTVSRYVVGFTLAETKTDSGRPLPEPVSAAVAELLDTVAHDSPDELFTFGLETLMDGLEARLRRG